MSSFLFWWLCWNSLLQLGVLFSFAACSISLLIRQKVKATLDKSFIWRKYTHYCALLTWKMRMNFREDIYVSFGESTVIISGLLSWQITMNFREDICHCFKCKKFPQPGDLQRYYKQNHNISDALLWNFPSHIFAWWTYWIW